MWCRSVWAGEECESVCGVSVYVLGMSAKVCGVGVFGLGMSAEVFVVSVCMGWG